MSKRPRTLAPHAPRKTVDLKDWVRERPHATVTRHEVWQVTKALIEAHEAHAIAERRSRWLRRLGIVWLAGRYMVAHRRFTYWKDRLCAPFARFTISCSSAPSNSVTSSPPADS